jgi:hypothetical protein
MVQPALSFATNGSKHVDRLFAKHMKNEICGNRGVNSRVILYTTDSSVRDVETRWIRDVTHFNV